MINFVNIERIGVGTELQYNGRTSKTLRHIIIIFLAFKGALAKIMDWIEFHMIIKLQLLPRLLQFYRTTIALFCMDLLFNNWAFNRILLSLINKLFIIFVRLNWLKFNIHIFLLNKPWCLNSNTLSRFPTQAKLTHGA